MIKFTQEMMSNLSFPDYAVEKMEFSPDTKTLKIFVQGGWIRVEYGVGYDLGPGVLFFSDWESISITRFTFATSILSLVKEFPVEPLEDLCEVAFTKSLVFLSGFGRETGKWMEWKIRQPKMHAEFEEYQEDDS